MVLMGMPVDKLNCSNTIFSSRVAWLHTMILTAPHSNMTFKCENMFSKALFRLAGNAMHMRVLYATLCVILKSLNAQRVRDYIASWERSGACKNVFEFPQEYVFALHVVLTHETRTMCFQQQAYVMCFRFWLPWRRHVKVVTYIKFIPSMKLIPSMKIIYYTSKFFGPTKSWDT